MTGSVDLQERPVTAKMVPETWPGTVVRFFTDPGELNRYRREHLGCLDDVTGEARGRTHRFKRDRSPAHFLVGVYDGRLSTLAHEAAHVAAFIVEESGSGDLEAIPTLTHEVFEAFEGLVRPPGQDPIGASC